MAYLDYMVEWWNGILPAEEHVHEVGESTAGCVNCHVTRLWLKLTNWERAALKWYEQNVTMFTQETGVVPVLLMDAGLTGRVRALFIRALSMIYNANQRILAERRRLHEQKT